MSKVIQSEISKKIIACKEHCIKYIKNNKLTEQDKYVWLSPIELEENPNVIPHFAPTEKQCWNEIHSQDKVYVLDNKRACLCVSVDSLLHPRTICIR